MHEMPASGLMPRAETSASVVARESDGARSQPEYTFAAECGGVEVIERLAPEWRALCRSGRYQQPFYQPEWIAACFASFYSTETVVLVTLRDAGKLMAVLPLVRRTRRIGPIRWRELRSLASVEHSCRFDVIGAPEAPQHAIAAWIWRFLRTFDDWDALILTNVPEGAAAERVVEEARDEGFPVLVRELARSPFIRLVPNDAREDLATFACSARLRSNLRRNWRKLRARGAITLAKVERADRARLEEFFALEQAGWKGRRGTAIRCAPETREFYERITRAADREGYLRMYFLEVAGQTIAARLGFVMGDCYFPVKIAYDEEFRSYAPGHVIVGLSLQDAARDGIGECDWLGRQSEWKLQWTKRARLHSNCLVFRDTIRGRVLFHVEWARARLAENARVIRRPVVTALRTWRARWRGRGAPHTQGN